MFWILISILIGLFLILYYCDSLYKDEEFEKIPGPKGIFLFGNSFDFLMESAPLFNRFRYFTEKYKDIYRLKLGPMKNVLIHNPEDVETILTNTKYNEKGYIYFFLRPWLSDGLLLSKGNKWFERRKILTPAFHFNILRNFSTALVENTEKFVESLQPEVGKEKTNIYPFITNMTLNSICDTAMGTSLDKESSDIGNAYKEAIHTLGTYLLHRAQRIWLHPKLFFDLSSTGRSQKKILNLLSSFRDRVIRQRRENVNYKNLYAEVMKEAEDEDEFVGINKRRLAMLDLLLENEEKGTIDIKGINEEVDTFMFEGHDTTSSALLFAFLLLANNPEEQDKAYQESLEIFGTSDRSPTMKDVAEMKYLEYCIKETMRLYPPVYFIQRHCNESLHLKNYKCSPGTECTILIFDLHRRQDQFVEPLKFRPERFQKEPTWHPFAYIPFSAGSRNCIGQKFAMIEMKLALSAVLRKYRLLPVTTPQDVIFLVDIILRPKDPIFVKFEKR